MESFSEPAPIWLVNIIEKAGGSISFQEFMNIALYDSAHGFYSSGRLGIGSDGDFATSPSLGPDFAELLAIQIIEWLKQLKEFVSSGEKISLIELGPGEGDLMFDLLAAIKRIDYDIYLELKIILVERTQFLTETQKQKLMPIKDINISWMPPEEIKNQSLIGIVIANEMMDAIPVERLVWDGEKLWRQGVTFKRQGDDYYLSFVKLKLPENLGNEISEIQYSCNISIPPVDAKPGWNTEFHSEIQFTLNTISSCLNYGRLLIIDYAMEAKRFYSSTRNSGTILAYKDQKIITNVLDQPGKCDLTSHLCIESLIYYAKKARFNFTGESRQGQALLGLGLAEKLKSLSFDFHDDLSIALQRRESLLRLVDPSCLGEFRWISFEINLSNLFQGKINCSRNNFLEPPN